ncbi:2,4-dienoyl-CoA reductase [Methylobacillus rhizosphaerae]|uniref:2,4-dienoyl-CoA reductase n=1 Tax=Methylobacillus rhizosphaerae TaxID=551994 RepID=A0A239ANA6_9PROT|nr:NADH:flavin oxidoreductase/NADH oxidase [Methylobacillus rhizosphaerae]SNR97039.1 2,4-dienoyl-CoA reductase [Methylobacillus rhizosphaerae]
MARLFTPIRFRDTEIKNRIFVSPMCQYSAEQGLANHWHLVHLGGLAVGGAGLVMVEATAVAPEGRITPFCLGIWSDEHVQALRPIVDFIRQQNAVPAIQLAHAGRKASCDAPWREGKFLPPDQGGWQTVAPSAIPLTDAHGTPQALSHEDIQHTIAQFRTAALRALQAGFEVLELHCAHGYLLHEFLSPLSNHRGDEYGGSLENRCRLPLQIARELRALWPQEKPVFVRISATDWVEGGWDIEQSIQFSTWLKEIGIDLIDCSSGGLTLDAKIPAGPGYQTTFAQRIRSEAGIASAAVGLITSALQAEHILVSGQADVIMMARKLLSDPHWPLHAARELRTDVPWPDQYVRAKNI